MNIGVIFDAVNKSGGGFFQSLSSAIMLNKIKDSKINFYYIVFSDETEKILSSKGLNTINFKKSFLFNLYKRFHKIYFIKKILNKINFNNPLVKLLKQKNINFLIFLGPSTLTNFIDDYNYTYNIYDIQHKSHSFFPEYRFNNYFSDRENIIKNSINKSFKVVVDTQTTKEDIVFYYNCRAEKIIVQSFMPYLPKMDINNESLPKDSKILKKINLKEKQKYLFYPAQFWPHKNHKYLIDFLNLMIKNKNFNYKIVCCGSKKSNRKYIDDLIEKNQLNESFIIFEYLNDNEVIQLYKNAFGVVMPTYVARSTLPLYESFYFRKPVFYSNDILDKKLYEFVIGFDLNEPADLVKKIESVENGEFDLIKLTNAAFEHYKITCSEEKFMSNYKKIIEEYNYLRNRWEN